MGNLIEKPKDNHVINRIMQKPKSLNSEAPANLYCITPAVT